MRYILRNVNDLLSNDIVVETGLALGCEADYTVLECKKGKVLTYTDVLAGKGICTALTEDDLTNADLLAMIDLNPKVFGIGISTVFGCARCFLMCHGGGISVVFKLGYFSISYKKRNQ